MPPKREEEEPPYGVADNGDRWRTWPSIRGKWTYEKRDDGSWTWKRIDDEKEEQA